MWHSLYLSRLSRSRGSGRAGGGRGRSRSRSRSGSRGGGGAARSGALQPAAASAPLLPGAHPVCMHQQVRKPVVRELVNDFADMSEHCTVRPAYASRSEHIRQQAMCFCRLQACEGDDGTAAATGGSGTSMQKDGRRGCGGGGGETDRGGGGMAAAEGPEAGVGGRPEARRLAAFLGSLNPRLSPPLPPPKRLGRLWAHTPDCHILLFCMLGLT